MKTRRDAWTKEDDKILLETVLEYVQNGDTKASAYKKASEVLGRTVSACAYRWNTELKQQVDDSPVHSSFPEIENENASDNTSINLNQVINYLNSFKENHPNEVELENRSLKEENTELIKLSRELEATYEEKQKVYQQLLKNYESVAHIFDKAKHMIDEHGGEKRVVH